MKLLRSFLPHLTIALALALAVLAYVDNRNPMMAFLSSPSGWTLIYAAAAVAILTAAVLVADARRTPPAADESLPNDTNNIEY